MHRHLVKPDDAPPTRDPVRQLLSKCLLLGLAVWIHLRGDGQSVSLAKSDPVLLVQFREAHSVPNLAVM